MAHLTNIPYMGKEQIELYLDTFTRVLYEEYGDSLPYIQVLIMGGSALGLKYNYRLTVDIDADVRFSGSKRRAIKRVAEIYNIPDDWLNEDVMKSESYSRLLWDNSIYYGNFYNRLEVRVVNDLDQLCMKATAGRPKDTEDIILLVQNLSTQCFTYADYKTRMYQLYSGTVKPKLRADRMIKAEFIKAYR